MLSMHDNEQYFFGALKAGACGYVLKSVADEDLVNACRAAMRGETFLYPARRARGARLPRPAAARRTRAHDGAHPAGGRGDQADRRGAIVQGDRASVDDLLKTVERHRANILGKLGMRDRTELTRYAIRAGLIEP